MKILIGYDGSEYSESALGDLSRGGLPGAADVEVMSAVDPWAVAAAEPGFASPILGELAMSMEAAAELSRLALESAGQSAEAAGAKIRKMMPGWKVAVATAIDAPSSAILRRADAWNADLIVIGSHGHGALRRFVLGSVSQSVLTHAHCSVRISRATLRTDTGPPKVVIGVDGSAGSNAAVAALAGRAWPAGTRVLAVAAIDLRVMLSEIGDVAEWDATIEAAGARDWTQNAVDAAGRVLRDAGLDVTAVVHTGDPKNVLIAEADRWEADCIFVGAKGLSAIERLLVGSVSTAVAERAKCSVEVVKKAE